MAALTAVPLSSGRGGVARRWGAWGGDVTGPTGEPMTQRGVVLEEAGGYKGKTSEGLALSGESTPLPGL
jgi:hypothetical protein